MQLIYIACYKQFNMSKPIIYIKPIQIIHENGKKEYGTEVTLEFDIDTVVYHFNSKGEEIKELYDAIQLGMDGIIHKQLSQFS